MPEYFLRIIGEEPVTKRMVAEDHDTAIRAAIRWEGHNPDMDLTCGLQRIAARRKSVWLLRPDAGCEDDEAFEREALDDFTKAAGWAGSATRARNNGQATGNGRLRKLTSEEPPPLRRRLSRWLRRP
jgi:hypothetical protein